MALDSPASLPWTEQDASSEATPLPNLNLAVSMACERCDGPSDLTCKRCSFSVCETCLQEIWEPGWERGIQAFFTFGISEMIHASGDVTDHPCPRCEANKLQE